MKTLERVRGSSRFESTAAEEGCTGTLYVLSNLCDLFLCLDGAGACDDLKAANTISPVAALQGKVAGVEIRQSDGGMFGATKIRFVVLLL